MPKRNHPLDYEKRLLEALQDLEKDPTLSIAKAAGHRGVPATTVRDRKNKGAQNPKSAHQHECLLSSAQEDVLVKWALFQDNMGISLCQKLLREKTEAILYIINLDINIGK